MKKLMMIIFLLAWTVSCNAQVTFGAGVTLGKVVNQDAVNVTGYKILEDATCGESITAGDRVVVSGSYLAKTAEATGMGSGSWKSCKMTPDGTRLVAASGSGAPAYFASFDWSVGNNRYEATNAPDITPTGIANDVDTYFQFPEIIKHLQNINIGS